MKLTTYLIFFFLMQTTPPHIRLKVPIFFLVLGIMKGCNFHILKGTHVSIGLLTLGFLFVMLWGWEKNPFLTTLLLAQQSFRLPSSGLFSPPLQLYQFAYIFVNFVSEFFPWLAALVVELGCTLKQCKFNSFCW